MADTSIVFGSSLVAWAASVGEKFAENPLGFISICVSIIFTVVAIYEKVLRIKFLKKRIQRNGNI